MTAIQSALKPAIELINALLELAFNSGSVGAGAILILFFLMFAIGMFAIAFKGKTL